jgi:subtilisin family serine protease
MLLRILLILAFCIPPACARPVIALLRLPRFPASGAPARVIARQRAHLTEARARLEADLPALKRRTAHWTWIAGTLSVDADDALERRLARHPLIDRVVEDARVSVPLLSSGRGAGERAWHTLAQSAIGVPKLRKTYGLTGRGVRVGVIDSGADGAHPDLKERIVLWKDLSGNPSAKPVDHDGHGTHVAGSVAGGASTGTWLGVAPDAELAVCRALVGPSVVTNLLRAMEWMSDPDGDAATRDEPRVVVMSWASPGADQTAFYRAIESMTRLGVVPCFSAGNAGTQGIQPPKEHPDAFVCGATDLQDRIAPFSSRGPATYLGAESRKPDWTAPGVDIRSAAVGGGTVVKSGTSCAAPHAAGLMALLLQARPSLTPAELKSLLSSTARDLGPKGWDGAYGWGRLDGVAAVKKLLR